LRILTVTSLGAAVKFIRALQIIALLASANAVAGGAGVTCDGPSQVPQTELLLLGELHGTDQAPDMAGKIACVYAHWGPTTLGVEIPRTDQAAIDQYLKSTGSLVAKRALLSGSFWQNDVDGRASAGMLALIEYVRRLQADGLAVSIFAFAQYQSGVPRDTSLARSIRAFRTQHPHRRMVILTGNVHASQAPSIQFGNATPIIPMGYLLRDLHPTSVDLAFLPGSAWVCEPKCGSHPAATAWGATRKPGFYTAAPMSGYSAAYVLRNATASPPAALVFRNGIER
jgi:hypothetical protein